MNSGKRVQLILPILPDSAAILENVKRKTYERAHIGEGSHVLDVGCGPGTDTIPLAKLVGRRDASLA